MADLNTYSCILCGRLVVGARICSTDKASHPLCQRIAATWYPTLQDAINKTNGKN